MRQPRSKRSLGWLASYSLACSACAASGGPLEIEGSGPLDAQIGSACGVSAACTCSAGALTGHDACGSACACSAVDAGVSVATWDGNLPGYDAAAARGPVDCQPGSYVGHYNCEIDLGNGPIPLMGDVSIALELSSQRDANGASCSEFCEDLVITEGKGQLQGVVFGVVGFKTNLGGGLDCQTGEFRAQAIDGIYGLPLPQDLNNLNGPWTIADPAFGTFEGNLQGSYVDTPPKKIEGSWGLADVGSGVRCSGPFEVTLQN